MAMKHDWSACDGGGPRPAYQEEPSETLDRRALLGRFGLAALTWLLAPSALAQLSIQPDRKSDNTLVFVFLRGGADGLSLLAPYREDDYFRLRPNVQVQAPKPGSELDLDGQFALHPGFASLLPWFKEGHLSCIHAVGSQDQSRSHFEAMAAVERGLADATGRGQGGWIARYLNATRADGDSPLRAISFSDTMPDSLRGSTQAMNLQQLSDYRLRTSSEREQVIRQALTQLYSQDRDAVSVGGKQTLEVLDRLNDLNPATYKPANSAAYPDSSLGNGLRDTAMLIKSGIGLDVACLDYGGWDTHVVQGTLGGNFEGLARGLADGLSAFASDLGPRLEKTTVVVMTEFGRRAYENSGLGTDHGRASIAMVLGGGVRGGKVRGEWPGMGANQLEEPGDLRVTTDYRSILADVLSSNFPGADLTEVFPDFKPTPMNLFRG